MAKQLNVNLQFTADTKQAQRELQSLQSQLTQLINKPPAISSLGITKEIKEASAAAATLKTQLENAINVDTGKLDLGKFSQSLKQGQYQLVDYKNALMALGPQGQQVFSSLANAITTAEMPLRRSSALLKEFGTTLKNTARWQISSTILHGFMGSIQSAYHYAQDLNESLNSIRIVTGQSADQMAIFAKQANKAAQELSTTTTAYTDAALIFYQQGLTGKDVTERTDAVIKLANVTGQSAEEVSSYMTAIWNNFDDGSESLEHYADVITALGASTASSSAEIAQGLEKFAAIGETVGLSYDYATSALATVVANTRQSADTVGTAFKTIFARIQGLKLGETLDDGVNLNKYSQALQSVGVAVLDTSGEMRDLDDILDDLAVKWKTLSSAQQTALAQTVAGTRQYNQLVSLMSNWDDMQQNLLTAQGAEGSLQEQADIYAESWEAASKRVRAAWQEVYDQLLDDKFFIGLTNGFASIAKGVSNLISGLGGVPGVLFSLGTVFMTVFREQMVTSIDNAIYSLQMMTKAGREAVENTRNNANQALQNMFASSKNPIDQQLGKAYASQAQVQETLIKNANRLTDQQKQIAQILLDQHQTLIQQAADQAELAKQAENQVAIEQRKVNGQSRKASSSLFNDATQNVDNTNNVLQDLTKIATSGQDVNSILKDLNETFVKLEVTEENFGEKGVAALAELQVNLIELTRGKIQLEDFVQVINEVKSSMQEYGQGLSKDKIQETLKNDINSFKELTTQAARLSTVIEGLFNNPNESANQYLQKITALKEQVPDFTAAFGSTGAAALEKFEQELQNIANANLSAEESSERVDKAWNNLNNELEGLYIKATEAQEGLENLGIETKNLAAAAESGGVQLGEYDVKLLHIKLSAQQTSEAIANLPTVMNNTAQNIQAFAQNVMSLGMAISNVKGLIQTWSDDTVSLGDKIIRTVTSLGMVIPILTTALRSETLQAIVGKVANFGFMKSLMGVGAGGAVATAGLIPLIATLGLVLAAIGAVVAVGVLLYNHFKSLEEQKPEKIFERAQQSAEEAANTVNKLSSEVEELNNQLDDLSDSTTVLEELEQGSKEWYEQVAKINKEISELLKKYPVLKNYIDTTSDVWKISDEGIAILKQQESNRLSAARIYESQQEINAHQAEIGVNLQSKNFDKVLESGDHDIGRASTLLTSNMEIFSEIVKRINDNYNENIGIDESYIGNLLSEYQDHFTNLGDDETFEGFVSQATQYFQANEDIFKSNAVLTQQIAMAQETQTREILSTLNSTRSANEFSNVVDYNSLFNTAREEAEQDFKWQRHVNYKDEDETVQRLLQIISNGNEGSEVKYKAQRNGSFVVDIDGKTQSYSKDQIYDMLASDKLSSGDWIAEEAEKITNQIRGELSSSFTNFSDDIAKMSQDKVIELDNARRSLINEFQLEQEQTDQFLGILFEGAEKAGYDFTTIAESVSGGINLLAQNDALQRTFTGYAQQLTEGTISLQEFAEEYNKLIEIGNLSTMTADFEAAAEGIGLKKADAAIMQEYAKNIMEMAESSDLFADSVAADSETAKDLAIQITRMNKGIDDLADGFENWSDVLKNSTKESQEYAEAMYGIKSALADILDVESDLISSKFVEDHLDEIKKAAEGDAEAIDALRANMDEEVLIHITTGQTAELVQEIYNKQDALNAAISNLDIEDIEVGAILDDSQLLAAANSLVDTAQMTADEANAYFAGIGYEPVYSTEDLDSSMEMPNGSTISTVDISPGGGGDYTWTGPFGGEHTIKLPSFTINTKSIPGETVDAPGTTRLVAFSGDSHNQPQIKGLRKKATGAQNNYSKSNAGGKAPGSSKSSKSGGGSSKQAKTKDFEKPVEDLADRYHDLNEAIQDVAHSMNMLSKAQEHLSGASLIKSLQKQNELISKQRENYAALNEELAKEAGELQGKLGRYGASFGEDGSILNYTDTFNAIKAEYNNAVDAYNSVIDWFNGLSAEQQDSVGEAAVKTAKEALDNSKDTYDKAKDYLSRYDEVIDDIQSNEEIMLDQLYEIIENNLKSFEVEIQLNLDINEATRTVNNFIKTITTDFRKVYKEFEDWSKSFDTMIANAATYTEGPDSTINTDLNALQQVKDIIDNPDYDYLSEGSMFASRDDAINKYKELSEQLMSDGEALYNLYQESWNEYLSAIDQVVDKWDATISEFDDINDELEANAQIIELLYGDTQEGRKRLDENYQALAKNSLAKQEGLNKEIAALEEQREQLLASGADVAEEDIKKINDAIKSANKELTSEIINYMQNQKKQLENANKMAISNMDQGIWGADFSTVQEQWQDAKKQADGYYDSVQRNYQLESLQNKWQSAINSTSSLKTQQQLNDLMKKQISELEKKTVLSETDVELAEKELEVYKAQIDLENAQNNKNAMKLVRNDQGNWAYQYVVDEDDVAEKSQALLDKTDEWRTFAIRSAEEVQEKIMEAYEEYTNRLIEVMNDTTLSEEERDARIAYLDELYWGADGIITRGVEESNHFQQKANEATFLELGTLYSQDQSSYYRMTEAEKALIDQLTAHGITDYSHMRDVIAGGASADGGIYGQLMKGADNVNIASTRAWNSLTSNAIKKMYTDPDSVKAMTNKAYDEMRTAFNTYQQAIVQSEQASGRVWTNTTAKVGELEKQIEDTQKTFEDLIKDTEQLSGFREKVDQIKTAWDSVKDAIINATNQLRTYLELLKQPVDIPQPSYNVPEIQATVENTPQQQTQVAQQTQEGQQQQQEEKKPSYATRYKITGTDKYGHPASHEGFTSKTEAENKRKALLMSQEWRDADPVEQYIIRLATGGYTGEWSGNDGKLALLHSKELVLNADDTKNMLSAVSAVRDIASIGNSFASTIANGISGMVAGVLGIRSGEVAAAASSDNTNNTFNITAEFPNANSVAEIQEAILSLPTLASQYLSQRKM